MSDPYVERLRFKVATAGNLVTNPPPLQVDHVAGSLRLEKDLLTFTPTRHFATEKEARQAIEPFLRSWEADSDLRVQIEAIRFVFQDATIAGRKALPPGASQSVTFDAAFAPMTAGQASFSMQRLAYPAPPINFIATPAVQTMVDRYALYRQGREPLQSMAYFCLSQVESLSGAKKGKRALAASKFKVHEDILSKIGELSTERGDALNARKVQSNAPLAPLSAAEARWLEAVLKLLIQRVGQEASGANIAQITMGDLPKM